MTLLDFDATAELFTWRHRVADAGGRAARSPARGRANQSNGMTYKRFSTGAEAVRFAIEDLPAPALAVTVLESDGERYDHGAIRTLYDSAAFPLPRRPAPKAE